MQSFLFNSQFYVSHHFKPTETSIDKIFIPNGSFSLLYSLFVGCKPQNLYPLYSNLLNICFFYFWNTLKYFRLPLQLIRFSLFLCIQKLSDYLYYIFYYVANMIFSQSVS